MAERLNHQGDGMAGSPKSMSIIWGSMDTKQGARNGRTVGTRWVGDHG